jgi:hypothetical protein
MNESEMDFRDEEVATMKAERDRLLAERDRLRAGLKWYSDQLPMSSGDIAREILAGEMPEELARRALEEK